LIVNGILNYYEIQHAITRIYLSNFSNVVKTSYGNPKVEK